MPASPRKPDKKSSPKKKTNKAAGAKKTKAKRARKVVPPVKPPIVFQDPPPLPALPFAACRSCGALVGVILTTNELFAHRRPLPDGSICDTGRRVPSADIVRNK